MGRQQPSLVLSRTKCEGRTTHGCSWHRVLPESLKCCNITSPYLSSPGCMQAGTTSCDSWLSPSSLILLSASSRLTYHLLLALHSSRFNFAGASRFTLPTLTTANEHASHSLTFCACAILLYAAVTRFAVWRWCISMPARWRATVAAFFSSTAGRSPAPAPACYLCLFRLRVAES